MYGNCVWRTCRECLNSFVRKSLCIVIMLTFGVITMCGCTSISNSITDEQRVCLEAVATLEDQEEYHFTTYTIQGNEKEPMIAHEYWVHGENYLSYTEQADGLIYWKMYINGECYIADEYAEDVLQWNPTNVAMDVDSPLVNVDLEHFYLESSTLQDGIQTIVFANDEKTVLGNVTFSERRHVFLLREDNSLAEYRYSFRESGPNSDETNTYVKKYHIFSEGEVQTQIQQQYQAIAKSEQ